MDQPTVLFLSSSEALPILEELALLVNQSPGSDWALSYLWNSDVFEPGKSFLQCLLEKASEVDFAVIYVSPDDQAEVRHQQHYIPRDNVIFEAGMCVAKLGPEKAVLVVENRVVGSERVAPKIPTDLSGIVHFSLTIPANYGNLPPSEKGRVIRAALNPVKKQVREHLLSRWDPSPPAETVPTRTTVNMESRPRQSGRIIPVYYDLKDDLNWFSVMARLLDSPRVNLPSEMLYYGPGAAYQWISAAGSGDGNRDQLAAFDRALADILIKHLRRLADDADGEFTVVDLGIGDFCKGEKTIGAILAYLQGRCALRYVACDISFEMVCAALGIHSGRQATVDRLTSSGNQVLGINAPFKRLVNYRDLFGSSSRVFLLFGNTLGNELSEQRTLQAISRAMRPHDTLIIEVQLKEDRPIPTDVITGVFDSDKQFYAGPLLAFGCSESDVSISASFHEQGHDDIDCWTYSCECTVHPVINRYIAPLRREVEFGGNQVVTTFVARKYAMGALDPVIEKVGLRIIDQQAIRPDMKKQRQFLYIIAEKQ